MEMSKYLKVLQSLLFLLFSLMFSVFTYADCTAEDSWFPHSQTPRPDDSTFKSKSNCEFHQWSWQMFLWLTQEVNGTPRFLGFNSPQSLLGMEQRGLFPRMGKSPGAESFDEFLQAGTDGILVDHNGKAVYYSQYINSTFETFITSNNLTDPVNVRAMDPNTEFPIIGTAGALELKASWKVVAKGEDTSGMFTMETLISKLENKNGKIVINPDKTEKETVALVGFHIGGIVKGHPEMIWATFEYQNNAPDVPPNTTLEQVVSDQDYLFYTAGTPLGECNVNEAISHLKLNQRKQTLSPITQVCRQYAFGNAEGVNTSNTNNIKAMNASVKSKINPTSVWANYFEVGAIWFLDANALEPGMSLATDTVIAPSGKKVTLTGSLSLSNATIETFTQQQSTMDNCFRCHNTAQEFPPKMSLQPLPATNLNISHAFQNIYFWSQELNAQK